MKDGFRCIAYCVDDSAEYREMMMVSLYSLSRVCHAGTVARVFFPPWAPPSDEEVDAMRRIASSGRARVSVSTVPRRLERVLRSLSGSGGMKLGPMTYARFLLPEILEGDDQCLYVDCDTLFTGDPEEAMSSFDAGSHRFFRTAGVRDLVRYIRPEREYGAEWYANAGVLLMDLDLWRRDFVAQRYVFDALSNDRHFNDQDVINSNEAPARLPCRMNFLGAWIAADLSVGMYNELYGTSYGSLQDAAADAVLLHYTGGLKPFRWMSGDRDVPERLDCMLGPYYVALGEYEKLTGRKFR